MKMLLSIVILAAALAIVAAPQAIAGPHCNPGKYAAWCAGASYDGPYNAPGSEPPPEQDRTSTGGAASDEYLLSKSKSKANTSVSAGPTTSSAQASSPLNGVSGRDLIEHQVRSRFGN
jgi:hypothetical protein